MLNEDEYDKKYGWSKKNISFTKSEIQLKHDIVDASEHIGFTKWMKLAAREKLERDDKNNGCIDYNAHKKEPIINTPKNLPPQMKSENSIIGSLDELFKKQ